MNQTFTITFGDQAENHRGMQIMGELADYGFDLDDLNRFKQWFENKRCICELKCLNDYLGIDINDKAYILIIKNGLQYMLENKGSVNDFYNEQNTLNKDKKALMYGKVVNKHARYNLCFNDIGQNSDYENGKGTIIAFDKVPLLNHVRNMMEQIIGEKGRNLMAEGNYYYDPTKCGIGWHGDSERKKVIGVRVGKTMPLVFNWFYKGEKVGNLFRANLEHGDIYIMSEKTTGCDWKKKNIYTLRHAAGASKYIA